MPVLQLLDGATKVLEARRHDVRILDI